MNKVFFCSLKWCWSKRYLTSELLLLHHTTSLTLKMFINYCFIFNETVQRRSEKWIYLFSSSLTLTDNEQTNRRVCKREILSRNSSYNVDLLKSKKEDQIFQTYVIKYGMRAECGYLKRVKLFEPVNTRDKKLEVWRKELP